MSINGINGTYGRLGLVREDARPRVEQGHGQGQTGAVRTPTAPLRTPATAAPTASLPVEAPPGTDPELWSVLSTEERAYFARAGAMGPLTYGRIMTGGEPTLPNARGGRLDVRA